MSMTALDMTVENKKLREELVNARVCIVKWRKWSDSLIDRIKELERTK